MIQDSFRTVTKCKDEIGYTSSFSARTSATGTEIKAAVYTAVFKPTTDTTLMTLNIKVASAESSQKLDILKKLCLFLLIPEANLDLFLKSDYLKEYRTIQSVKRIPEFYIVEIRDLADTASDNFRAAVQLQKQTAESFLKALPVSPVIEVPEFPNTKKVTLQPVATLPVPVPTEEATKSMSSDELMKMFTASF